MDLEFWEATLDRIGAPTSSADAMWATLSLSFRDRETDRILSIQTTLFVPKGADVTIAELQTAARDRAATILRAALACLEANDVASLENMSPPPT